MSREENTSSRLRNLEALERLGGLQVRAQRLADGLLAGLHRSPRHGQSVEFAEHKSYAPGDDVRRIDWKVYGRRDRLTVKRFEEETHLRAMLVVDGSGSMAYRGNRSSHSKWEVASLLAATLGHILTRQGDGIGLAIAATAPPAGVVPYLEPPPASGAQLLPMIEALENWQPTGPGALDVTLQRLEARGRGSRGLVLIFSDLFEFTQASSLQHLWRLNAGGHEAVLFQVLDRDELDFPFEGPSRFESMENSASMESRGRDVRAGYLAELEGFLSQLRATALRQRSFYQACPTDSPLDGLLLPFLTRKPAAGRRGALR